MRTAPGQGGWEDVCSGHLGGKATVWGQLLGSEALSPHLLWQEPQGGPCPPEDVLPLTSPPQGPLSKLGQCVPFQGPLCLTVCSP